MSLHPLWGHEDLKHSFGNARVRDTLPASILLHGASGTGKQRLALWIGQLLLCENGSGDEPCDACQSCRMVANLEHPDLHWFFPIPRPKGATGSPEKIAEALEKSRFEALDELRAHPLTPRVVDEPQGLYLAAAKTIRRKALKRPSMSARQVFIIGDAETLVPQAANPEAANALLKLLEEPPPDTVFILTSSAPGRLLDTIRSRTHPLHVARLSRDDVSRFLIDVAGADEKASDHAARLGQGSIGRALAFLPNGEEEGPLEQVRQEAFHVLRAGLGRGDGAFSTGLGFPVSKARALGPLFEEVASWLRDLGAATVGATDEIINQDGVRFLVRVADEDGIGADQLTRALASIEQAKTMAEGNVNPQLVVAGLVSEMKAAFGGVLEGP